MTLTRTALETRYLQTMIARSGVALSVLSEAELQASLDTLLQSHPPNTDVLIFAYGSGFSTSVVERGNCCNG